MKNKKILESHPVRLSLASGKYPATLCPRQIFVGPYNLCSYYARNLRNVAHKTSRKT